MIARLNSSVFQTTAAAGAWAVELFWYAGSLSLLLVQTVRALARPLRLHAAAHELWKVGVQSWFIVTISSLFIGMVLAFQSAYQMQKLGAEIYIASLVALSVVREIGPVITALIVAGRVGSAIAAELGTMKVTEQIDALVTLAADPVRFLVAPRFVAMLIALPLLTLWADAVGILGGFLVGTFKLGVLPSLYWKMTTIPLLFRDLTSGLLKALVFAVIICTVSCFEGFRTDGGAEGVGRRVPAGGAPGDRARPDAGGHAAGRARAGSADGGSLEHGDLSSDGGAARSHHRDPRRPIGRTAVSRPCVARRRDARVLRGSSTVARADLRALGAGVRGVVGEPARAAQPRGAAGRPPTAAGGVRPTSAG